ncbi:hypothetical protein ACIBI9_11215 [Nonomuraea sp. NPDC050451]|uniref:hypothetical protein n=1 Tax=Nonomuraea sp. NPDC050451 TaxID=3364364 RepID=UPI0037AC2E9A
MFRHPHLRALYIYDKETIGRAYDDPQLAFQCYRFTTFTLFRNYLRMLHESEMWDPSHGFALNALLSGFIELHLHAEIVDARPDLAPTPTVWPASSGALSSPLIKSRPKN